PQNETITFCFINDAGQKVYKNVTKTGAYGSTYSYKPKVPWYDSLSSASQAELTGKYNIPKRIITVHYTRRQAEFTLYFVDDRGNLLGSQTHHSYEGLSYHFNLPHYNYLVLVNSKLQSFGGEYKAPRIAAVIEYKHIPAYLTVNLSIDGQIQNSAVFDGYWGDSYYYPISPLGLSYLTPYPGYSYVSGRFNAIYNSVTLNYYYVRSTVTLNLYGTNGAYLTSYSQSGEYGQPWSFNLPSWIGNYQLAMNSNQSGYFDISNQSYTIYYTEVVKSQPPKSSHYSFPYPQVGTVPWLVKEGMTEYGDNPATMKQYLEYAYAGNPSIEAKVAAEYHDSKPAPYYGAMSVGNSPLAQQLQQYRKTTQVAIKQYEKYLKSETTQSKNTGTKSSPSSNNLLKSLGLTTILSLMALGLAKLGNVGGGTAGDNIWIAGLSLLEAAGKGDLKKNPVGAVGQLTADFGISWATSTITGAITDAGIGGAVGGPLGVAIGFGVGVIFDTAISNSGDTDTIYDDQLVSGLDRSGTSAEDFGGN
ncbi:hypothetical protein ACFO26_10150, partial [Lactococcus nasutitermitis]